MNQQPNAPSLASLAFIPYVNDRGFLPDQFQAKVGVYAIFDQSKTLQYVGYSRDVYLSLKQHLVRQPEQCYWVKIQTIERPSRTTLEAIRDAWITEAGSISPDSQTDLIWSQPINVKAVMSEVERHSFEGAIDESAQAKALKQAARRLEADILQRLKQRGVQEELRFNPKLKEEGLLDLK